MTLPVWALSVVDSDNMTKINVDPAVAYPLYLEALGFGMDWQSVRIARKCIVLDLLELLGPGITVVILPHNSWKRDNLPDNPLVTGFLRVYTALLAKRDLLQSTDLPL